MSIAELRQCRPDADVLFDRFRDDVGCEVLKKFQSYGVTLRELRTLQKKLPVVFPWSSEYDRLRYNVNRRFVFFPMCICMARTKEHVVKMFRWAKRRNIPITLRGGSHCFESYSLSDGIIIDQSRRTGMQSDGTVARLEPGCLIGPTQLSLSKKGLGMVGGTCPNTCVSGLTLGGGIGFLNRKFGLASDNLLGAEVLTADGRLVKCSSQCNPDLFWALRGAGNQNYGIVTELVFRVHRLKKVAVFDLNYEFSQLEEVLNVWQKWAPHTVDELTSELDVYSDRVLVTGLYLGCKKELRKMLGEVFGSIQPVSLEVEEMPFVDSVRHFAGQGHWHPFFENKSGFARQPFSAEAVTIIKKWMPLGGDEDHLELDAFGGLANRISSDATAFVHRDTLFWCHLQKHWTDQDDSPTNIAWITDFYDELKPHLSGAYINAPDRDLPNALQEYYGTNLPRLIRTKRKWDPDNVFHYQQSIPTC